MGPKRLIICLDGTWNTPEGEPTNVVKIHDAILPMDSRGTLQMRYYDVGVGTGGVFDRLSGGLTGEGVEQKIKRAYLYLCKNYQPHDEIYLFGFSRGAFSARSLGALIGSFGLLRRSAWRKLNELWPIYQRGGRATPELEAALRKVDVKVEGVWDTVGARGIPVGLAPFRWLNRRWYGFHNTHLPLNVEYAFHALALDEWRGAFSPTLWTRNASADEEASAARAVEQTWFAGSHADVGGGYPECGLADLSLAWMVHRLRTHTALEFDESYLQRRLIPFAYGPQHNSAASYLYSRVRPALRAIGGTRQELRKQAGFRARCVGAHKEESIGEMVHWSATVRSGRTVAIGKRKVPYNPANLRVAQETVPVFDEDREWIRSLTGNRLKWELRVSRARRLQRPCASWVNARPKSAMSERDGARGRTERSCV